MESCQLQDKQDNIDAWEDPVLLQELVEFLAHRNVQVFTAFRHPHITKGTWSLSYSTEIDESAYWIKEYYRHYNMKPGQQSNPFKRKCGFIQDTFKRLCMEKQQREANAEQTNGGAQWNTINVEQTNGGGEGRQPNTANAEEADTARTNGGQLNTINAEQTNGDGEGRQPNTADADESNRGGGGGGNPRKPEQAEEPEEPRQPRHRGRG